MRHLGFGLEDANDISTQAWEEVCEPRIDFPHQTIPQESGGQEIDTRHGDKLKAVLLEMGFQRANIVKSYMMDDISVLHAGRINAEWNLYAVAQGVDIWSRYYQVAIVLQMIAALAEEGVGVNHVLQDFQRRDKWKFLIYVETGLVDLAGQVAP